VAGCAGAGATALSENAGNAVVEGGFHDRVATGNVNF
jgi:hypothetical protein